MGVRNRVSSVEESSKLGDTQENGSLPLFESVVIFVTVTLGVLVSIGLVAWCLSFMSGFVSAGMFLAPHQLLLLSGQVVRDRAMSDWCKTRSMPLIFRLVRVFFIGFCWPLWITRLE